MLFFNIKNNFSIDFENIEKLENIDEHILFQIQDKLEGFIEMKQEERKFLNGVIRKYKPNKILEVGVAQGGSSALILNAIKEYPNSKLYSIDRSVTWYQNHNKKVGWLVKEKFPELLNKWTLYAGNNPAENLETIGNNIDLVFIDTMHVMPGEMLNFLEVLPFLKEEAIIVMHDIFIMFNHKNFKNKKLNYSNNQLICYIRGKLILPSYGDKEFSRNIGAIKLDKNQKQYYKQYFLALGNLWEYFPSQEDLIVLRAYFKKYYGENLVKIYDDAIEKNKIRFKSK